MEGTNRHLGLPSNTFNLLLLKRSIDCSDIVALSGAVLVAILPIL